MTTDAYGNIRSDQFPVTAGQGYDATAWIRGEVDVDDSRDGTIWIVRVRWEDLNGTYLSYSNGEVGTAAGGLPASFAEKGGTVTAPVGAVYGRVEVCFYLASGWFNVDDVSVTPTTTTNITETKYYGFGGDTVGMRVDGELSWMFSDQLGSTGITYQADGTGTSRQFYYPFGGIRNPGGAPVVDTDVGFTGQRLDTSTGLMFYQARYYDPVTARFISADTMVPDPGNPQDFNRYSYVRNNPLGYADPSGNVPLRLLDGAGARITGFDSGGTPQRASVSRERLDRSRATISASETRVRFREATGGVNEVNQPAISIPDTGGGGYWDAGSVGGASSGGGRTLVSLGDALGDPTNSYTCTVTACWPVVPYEGQLNWSSDFWEGTLNGRGLELVGACAWSITKSCGDNIYAAASPFVSGAMTYQVAGAIPLACGFGPVGCGVAIVNLAPAVVAGTYGTFLLAERVWFGDLDEVYKPLNAPWRD